MLYIVCKAADLSLLIGQIVWNSMTHLQKSSVAAGSYATQFVRVWQSHLLNSGFYNWGKQGDPNSTPDQSCLCSLAQNNADLKTDLKVYIHKWQFKLHMKV